MSKDTFVLNIPISKIDEEQRIVTGIATSEALDSQGDIVDYEASKKAFSDWAGNIREMHGDKAVGKRIDVQFDDATKQVIVSAKISESADGENAWIKVKEKVLTGFSIGGRVFEVAKDKAIEGANRVMDYALSELSLVDNPACPDAQLLMVKSADGGLQRVETLSKAGINVVDGDPRDASGNTVSEVLAGTAPKKGGTLVPKKVVARDGISVTVKANEANMQKSVDDAAFAASLASQLTYLIMCEEPDQAQDLIDAFNALRDFIGKEVAEGDDWVLQSDSVIEMAQQAINLRKGTTMADKEELEKTTNVIAGEERDENAHVVETAEEAGRPVNDTEERAVESGKPVDNGEEVTVKTEGEEEAVAEDAKSADESKEDGKGAKSDVASDLVKSVQSLVAKLGEQKNDDLVKMTDLVKDLGDKVEKSLTSLEDRIKSLEDQPVATKAKASFVVSKGEEVENVTAELAELTKRQDELIANPSLAKPGEVMKLSFAIRKALQAKQITS